MKIITEDNTFLNYLSKGNNSKEPEKKLNNLAMVNSESSENIINTNVSHFISTADGDFKEEKERDKSVNNSKIKSHFFSNNILEDSKDVDAMKFTKGFSHLVKNKTLVQTKHLRTFTEKETREILDHYKDTFELKKNESGVGDSNNFCSTYLPSISKSNNKEDGLTSTQKSQMFKSSIYSLLLPTKYNKTKNITGGISTSDTLKTKSSTSKVKTSTMNSVGPFLNFNYEEYNKKIEIKNPEVKKILEDINYYGPYFSHCPSCRNKNLDFYQTLEPHSCLNILNFLKKTRNKSKFVKEGK